MSYFRSAEVSKEFKLTDNLVSECKPEASVRGSPWSSRFAATQVRKSVADHSLFKLGQRKALTREEVYGSGYLGSQSTRLAR
jgi:hypothetical protein